VAPTVSRRIADLTAQPFRNHGRTGPFIAWENRLYARNRSPKKTSRQESFLKKDFTPGIVAEKRHGVK
jgi:hypothetical protein